MYDFQRVIIHLLYIAVVYVHEGMSAPEGFTALIQIYKDFFNM